MTDLTSSYISAGAGVAGALFGAFGALAAGILTHRSQRKQSVTAARREAYSQLITDSRKISSELTSSSASHNSDALAGARARFVASMDSALMVAGLAVRPSLERWDEVERTLDSCNVINGKYEAQFAESWECARREFLERAVYELNIGTGRRRLSYRSELLACVSSVGVLVSSGLTGVIRESAGDEQSTAFVALRYFALPVTLLGTMFVLLAAFLSWRNIKGEGHVFKRHRMDPQGASLIATILLLGFVTLDLDALVANEGPARAFVLLSQWLPLVGIVVTKVAIARSARRAKNEKVPHGGTRARLTMEAVELGGPSAPAGSGAARPSAQEGRPGPSGPA